MLSNVAAEVVEIQVARRRRHQEVPQQAHGIVQGGMMEAHMRHKGSVKFNEEGLL